MCSLSFESDYLLIRYCPVRVALFMQVKQILLRCGSAFLIFVLFSSSHGETYSEKYSVDLRVSDLFLDGVCSEMVITRGHVD